MRFNYSKNEQCKTNRNRLQIATSLIVFTSFYSISHVAASGSSTHHEASILDLFWYVINFAVYCTGVYFLARKKIAEAWIARSENIENLTTKAEKALKDAQEKNIIAKKDESELEQRCKDILAHSEKSAANEIKLIEENTKNLTENLKKQNMQLIESEEKTAISSIESIIIKKVLTKSETILKDKFNKEHDSSYKSLVENSLKNFVGGK